MKWGSTTGLFLLCRGQNVDERAAQRRPGLFGILRWNGGKRHSENNWLRYSEESSRRLLTKQNSWKIF